jgi:hypothetical protein
MSAMGWMSEAVGRVLDRYTGAGASGASGAAGASHEDYTQVAAQAPPEVVAGGLAQAFRSDSTPPFPEMLANLFKHSNPDQRVGLLNHLLGSLGPGALSSIPGLGALAGAIGGGNSVTPQQAASVAPDQVQQAAAAAERQDPSIVDQASRFYSQHSDAVKAMGGVALAIALGHIAKHR